MKRSPRPILDKRIGRFAKRLEKTIAGNSVRSFARNCGLAEGTVRGYLRGDSYPTLDKLALISAASGRPIEWLATGAEPERPPVGMDAEDIVEEFALVPLYDVAASAGYGSLVEQERIESQIAFRRDWLRREGLKPKDLAAISAIGDSMEPTIRPGALLVIDNSQRTIGNDDVYVLRLDDHLLAKRLQRMINGSVRVMSDNPIYKEEIVPPDMVDKLDVVGRVVWVGQKL